MNVSEIKQWLTVCLLALMLVMVHTLPRHRDVPLNKNENSLFKAIKAASSSHFQRQSSSLRHLVKRWDRMMFSCGCDGFRAECKTNLYCSRRYGHGSSCHTSCCGTRCLRAEQ